MNDVAGQGGGRHQTTTLVSGATRIELLADEGGINNYDDDGRRCNDDKSPSEEGGVDDDNNNGQRCNDDCSLVEDDDKLPADEGNIDDNDKDNRATSG